MNLLADSQSTSPDQQAALPDTECLPAYLVDAAAAIKRERPMALHSAQSGQRFIGN